MNAYSLIRYLISGTLHRDFIITSQGKTYFDIPGGSLPYAAAGFSLWDTGIGLVTTIGEDFPHEWLIKFSQYGFDTRGVSIQPRSIDLRSFIFYLDNKRYETENPIAQFVQLGIPIPKSLLGYVPEKQRPTENNPSRSQSIIVSSIPLDYLDATASHLCPLNLENQSRIISFLQGHVNTISLDPDKTDMNASAWEKLPNILKNIHILQISEEKIISLFRGRLRKLWDMIEALAEFGLEIIVVKKGKEGQILYDCHAKKRWAIPAYPARIVDTTGCGDSFCGGFIAGFRNSYDPLEATLKGNISASVNIEGTGPFFSMQVLSGLAQARLNNLRGMVKKL